MALPPPPTPNDRDASAAGGATRRSLPPPPPGANIAAHLTGPSSGAAPAPNVESLPPRPPRKPIERRTLLAIIGSAAALAIAVAGVLVWQRISNRPSAADLHAYLAAQVSSAGLAIGTLDTSYQPAINGSVPIAFTVRSTTKESLYTIHRDQQQTLRQLSGDLTLYNQARSLLGSRNGSRLTELAGGSLAIGDLQKVLLLEKATAVGTPITYAGTAVARKQGTLWVFSVSDAAFLPQKPEGKPRAEFAAPNFVVGDPPEEMKFKSFLAQTNADAARVVDAAKKYAIEFEKLKTERQASFLATIAPGTLFTGTATRKYDVRSFPISLEITDVAARTHKLTALLRNDGGWADARTFQGEWSTDAEAETFRVTVTSQQNQAIREAGPILQETHEFTLALVLDEHGGASGDNDNWAYRLTRVPPDQLQATKLELGRSLREALDATKVDRFYRGTVISNSTHLAEAVLLHFVKQQNEGAQLAAKVESTERPWSRTLNGTLIGNRNRGGDTPVRLRMAGADRVAAADSQSFFGAPYDRDLAFRIEGDQLSADNGQFTFKLERASDEFVAELLKTRQLQAEHVASTLRAGAVYDGVLRNGEGYAHRVRMRIVSANGADATVKLALDSREQAGISHEFSGVIERVTGAVLLHSTGKGRFNPSGVLKVPFFSREAEFGLTLAVLDEQIALSLNNHPWTGEFTIRASSADAGNARSASAGGSSYPTEHGAYVWQDGAWKKLPANNCKPSVGALGQVTNVLSGLNGVLGAFSGKKVSDDELRKPDKLADLEFSGLDEVPVVDGSNVTIIFVGNIPALPANLVTQYPDLRKYPKVEMAPTRVGQDGKRRADLIRIVPGVAGFRDTRVAAIVEEVAPQVTELRCTAAITPGAYAVTAGAEGFEVNVE